MWIKIVIIKAYKCQKHWLVEVGPQQCFHDLPYPPTPLKEWVTCDNVSFVVSFAEVTLDGKNVRMVISDVMRQLLSKNPCNTV